LRGKMASQRERENERDNEEPAAHD
jgi:hypothetical protein